MVLYEVDRENFLWEQTLGQGVLMYTDTILNIFHDCKGTAIDTFCGGPTLVSLLYCEMTKRLSSIPKKHIHYFYIRK